MIILSNQETLDKIIDSYYITNKIEYNNKKITAPTKDNIRYSIELEFVNAKYEHVRKKIEGYNLKWQLVRDASLYNNRNINPDDTGETFPNTNNKLYYVDKTIKEIDAVSSIIKELGGKADEFCGLHVHIDGAVFQSKGQIIRLLTNVYNVQSFLIQLINMRKGGLIYSRPLPNYFVKGLKTSKTYSSLYQNWYNSTYMNDIMKNMGNSCWSTNPTSKYNATRYSLINLHSLFNKETQTVEFRLFNGTLELDTIMTCVSLCLELVLNSININRPLLFNKKITSFIEFNDKMKNILSTKELICLNNIYKDFMVREGIDYGKVGNFYLPKKKIESDFTKKVEQQIEKTIPEKDPYISHRTIRPSNINLDPYSTFTTIMEQYEPGYIPINEEDYGEDTNDHDEDDDNYEEESEDEDDNN